MKSKYPYSTVRIFKAMPPKFKIWKRRKGKEGDSISVASGISFQEGQ